jgi:release factor glutamine methyltransferase
MIEITKSQLLSLAKKYDVTPREALNLLSEITATQYDILFFEKTYQVTQLSIETLYNFLMRRGKGEPIAKIIQKKEFYESEFKTNEHTLDPRPETELIVDLFRKYHQNIDIKLKILDLGCGTGCIGLSIMKLYQNVTCNFADISENALAVAKENASRLNLSTRCNFIISNWFSNIDNKYDIIVSNPPYVTDNYELDNGASFDPPISLFAGKEGMDSYKVILPDICKFLKYRAKLFLEIGFDQKNKVLALANNLKLLESAKDAAGIFRTMVFENRQRI